MKKAKWLPLLLLLLLGCLYFIPVSVRASAPLDEIQDYTIKVNMRPDGTMDIRYHIEWKVLDDSSVGPLTWIQIGNPNEHVDEITALSDNIKEIRYFSENGGSYIRVDLDREYYQNETVIFDYTIHQSYMYIIERDNHICRYSFTPGWFEEIEVKNITIMWNKENVIESNAQREENGYLIWNSTLGMGERLNASVKYNLDAFTTNEEEQYVEGAKKVNARMVIGVVIIIIIGVGIVFCIIFYDDDYNSHSGFGGRRSTYIHTHSSCVRSSCACVRSCACACACAGGGRAGCSKKDFYQTNLKTEDIKKVLK